MVNFLKHAILVIIEKISTIHLLSFVFVKNNHCKFEIVNPKEPNLCHNTTFKYYIVSCGTNLLFIDLM